MLDLNDNTVTIEGVNPVSRLYNLNTFRIRRIELFELSMK